MGVKLGFHEATLHASFTPKATSAAERLSRSEASCLNYAKSCARGRKGFQEAMLHASFTPKATPVAVNEKLLSEKDA